VVIGVGGLGHMGVQILRALTPARIVAIDLSADKLRLAREVGAHETVESGDGAHEAVLELTGGLGAEVMLDFVGAEGRMAQGR
jgi:propanol-preferring alcohol dehydrogenase